MVSSIALSSLEEDMLKELFNLGVGKAAASLSRMVKQEVILSVPKVSFKTANELLNMLGTEQEIVSISQDVKGPFNARSMLLFHEESSMYVVKQMLGKEIPDEMIAELQEEALTEIGNVVLNACVGSISKSMQETFKVEIPTFQQANSSHILDDNQLEVGSSILLLEIGMTLKDSDVTGYLAFVFGSDAVDNLHLAIKKMLKKIGAM